MWYLLPKVPVSSIHHGLHHLSLVMFMYFMFTSLITRKLLEFRANGDSLYHTLTLDFPARSEFNFERPMNSRGGYSPFLYIKSQEMIFDAETQSFYHIPRFKSSLVGDHQHALPVL